MAALTDGTNTSAPAIDAISSRIIAVADILFFDNFVLFIEINLFFSLLSFIKQLRYTVVCLINFDEKIWNMWRKETNFVKTYDDIKLG